MPALPGAVAAGANDEKNADDAANAAAQAKPPARKKTDFNMEFLFVVRDASLEDSRQLRFYLSRARSAVSRRATDWAIWRTVAGGASPSTVTRWSSLLVV